MKEVKKPSAIPIYGLAAAWLLYCLIFPTYRIWHFLICAAVSVLVFFVLKKIFPGTVELVEEPVSTGDAERDALLADGKTAVSELQKIGAKVKDRTVAQKVDTIAELTAKLYDDVRKDPSDFRPVRRFTDYYRPTTEKLLRRYTELQDSEIESENICGAKKRIEDMLDSIITAYQKELNSLYENDLVDITADIQVMEQKMAAEGLTEQKEL